MRVIAGTLYANNLAVYIYMQAIAIPLYANNLINCVPPPPTCNYLVAAANHYPILSHQSMAHSDAV